MILAKGCNITNVIKSGKFKAVWKLSVEICYTVEIKYLKLYRLQYEVYLNGGNFCSWLILFGGKVMKMSPLVLSGVSDS